MAKLPQNPDDDLRARGITTISMLGKRVAAMLDILYGGLYHLHSRQLRSIDWGHPTSMSLVVSEELSTFDFSLLTRLVFLAHDYAVRVAVQPAGPRHLRIQFSLRERDAGNVYTRHPSLDAAIRLYRGMYHDEDAWRSIGKEPDVRDG